MTIYCLGFSLYAGLPVKNPVHNDHKHVSKKKKSTRTKKAVRRAKEESDSEEEWQPWMEEQKQRPKKRGECNFYRICMHVSETEEAEFDVIISAHTYTCTLDVVELSTIDFIN